VTSIEATALNGFVGERIRARGRQLGLTHADMARSIGVSPRLMKQYEDGVSALTAARLLAISELLSAPVDYFFPDYPERSPTRGLSPPHPTGTPNVAGVADGGCGR
jgi:transcriptional regulator with XRE-family HTH domain